MKIPFLTFADDRIIFPKTSKESCTIIRSILDTYYRMSGQLVNYSKLAYHCSPNTEPYLAASFSNILQMAEARSLGKYLGCPIIDTKVTNATFGDIREKVQSQLSKRKSNSLTQAGRTILIQSNLATMANYQMQSFSLPTYILDSLDKSYRNFFWNKPIESKAPNLIGWEKVCKPKRFGGLCIRKAKIANIALQFKLLWKIISSPENLWVSLVTKKYLKADNLFEYKMKANVYWQWRSLMWLRQSLRKGLRWIIGNGEKISFWFDNWAF